MPIRFKEYLYLLGVLFAGNGLMFLAMKGDLLGYIKICLIESVILFILVNIGSEK